MIPAKQDPGNGQIFAEHAPQYAEVGFRVFPTGGEDGKRPLIKGWPRVGRKASLALAKKFPDANLGVIDGDVITRIDVDDPDLIDGAIKRFGDTPIKVGTPRGGLHLWFRAQGERRVIGLEGEKIDVLGKGGFGNAPPSINPLGGSYRFLEGSLADVPHLPGIKDLPPEVYEPTSKTVTQGRRNKTLLTQCLRDLADGHDPDLIQARAEVWNEGYDPPMGEAEVAKTAESAVKMHLEGRNWIGKSGVLQVTRADFEAFGGDSDAFFLFSTLQFNHGSHRKPFPIASRSMAEAEVIPGWGHNKYEAKTKRLLDMGKIKLIRRGGGKGNPNLYTLINCPCNWALSNKHPLPPSMASSSEVH